MAITDSNAFLRTADAAPARYPVNLRFTIPFYPNPIFVTLIVGKEKRGAERLREERSRHPIQTWGNLAMLAATWTVVSIAALFAAMVAGSL